MAMYCVISCWRDSMAYCTASTRLSSKKPCRRAEDFKCELQRKRGSGSEKRAVVPVLLRKAHLVLVDVDPVSKLGGRGVECQQGVRGLPGVGGLGLQPEQLRAQPVAARHERVAKLLR